MAENNAHGKMILLVEDEKNISDLVKVHLEKEGYQTVQAFTGTDGLKQALSGDFDLILLDIMLPEIDGFDICRKVREKSMVPIIMLTAKEEEIDRVLGLEIGADDYITKPFSIRELTSRIKANIRRSAAEPTGVTRDPGVKQFGDLQINISRFEVVKGGESVYLTLREFELLQFLSEHVEQIFSREDLLHNVWGEDYFGDPRVVDVAIRRLREKVEEDPASPKLIKTKRGLGYYFAN